MRLCRLIVLCMLGLVCSVSLSLFRVVVNWLCEK